MSGPEVVIAALDCLTPREAEAVLWVAQGKTSWEAGRILGVAASTLDAHIAHAAEKLQAVNRAHLVTRAFLRGILAAGASQAVSLLLIIVCVFGPHDVARVRRVSRARCRRDYAAMVVLRTPGGSA
jgi:DNA-binding CsgD family transcriptional regulator